MSEIISDLSGQSMALAVERNLLEFWTLLSDSPLVQFERTPELIRLRTGVPFPLMNGILDARLDGAHAEAKIDEALGPFKADRLPMMWWTGPSTTPPDLGDTLAKRGLTPAGILPGMAVDLRALNEPPAPEGLRIEAADPGNLDGYAQVLAAGFAMPAFVGKALIDIISSLSTSNPPWRLYLGYLGGKAVATSMMVFAGGVAGIYNVATLPEARARGVGAEMTLAGLRDAREAGYRIGILQSSSMGYSVYKRLGFQDYCEIGQYIWMPPEQR